MASFELNAMYAADGTKIRKTPTSSYPNIYRFNSESRQIATLQQFHKAIQDVAHEGGCILKGVLQRPLNNESRAGSTNGEILTKWACLDLDGADYESPEAFIAEMPPVFHNVSYVLQYSSSHGIKPGLRCHLFFILEDEMPPIVLKQLLLQWNFKAPSLKSGLNLTASNMALTYPLDVTVCQNDKLIYLAPMEGKRISKNTFQLIKKKKLTLDLIHESVSIEQNKIDQKACINELRKAKGMSARKQINVKEMGQLEVMSSPDQALVTGRKEDGDFVYLNLNGGDSWAYYHLKSNPEFILNFKGEPSYKTSELLPDYYKTVRVVEYCETDETKEYFAVLDKASTTYVLGYYEKSLNMITIELETKSLTHVNHYMLEHGYNEPDHVPTWDVIHDFTSDIVYDEKKKVINKYKPSEYMSNAVPGEMTPKMLKLIQHTLNYDEAVVEHFLNWLAVVFQHKTRTRTAWIVHGTQGTGKGILFSLLSKIIGEQYTSVVMLHDIERDYNGFIDNSLLVCIDEAQMSSLRNPEPVIEKIKHFVTDSPIRINEKNRREHPVTNFSSTIIFSNQHDPMKVPNQDRRFNIAPRQEVRLLDVMSDTEIDELFNELQPLANYLLHRTADVYKAGQILDTAARSQLQDTTRTSNEQVADALRSGDFGFFVDNIPDAEFFPAALGNAGMLVDKQGLPTYEQLLGRMFDSIDDKPVVLDRYDLAVLFYGVSGMHCKTKNKFGRFMNMMHLPLQPTRTEDGLVRAIAGIKFKASEDDIATYKRLCKGNNVRRIK